MAVDRTDWPGALAHYLVKAGLQGKTQADIVMRFRSWASAAELENELEAWQVEGKVQKFKLNRIKGRTGRPTVLWRATTKMVERID